jgi:diguanylate cyclase (GGDEF)-like protein
MNPLQPTRISIASVTVAANPVAGAPRSTEVDPASILQSIGETVYDWNIQTDVLSWGGSASSLFGSVPKEALGTGSGFSRLIDPVSPITRSEAILLSTEKDSGQGVPYKLVYAVQHGRNPLVWFEDTGRWFAGLDGRPTIAHGSLRKVSGPSEQERREIVSNKFDPLTGAFQRGPFLKIMADDLKRPRRSGHHSAFLLIGLNDLDFVNQTYGYEAADEVLAAIAKRLRETIRGRDRLVRYSGTKLGVWLNPFDSEEPAEAVERIMSLVSQAPVATTSGPIAIGLHVGSTVAPRDGNDPIRLLRQAEEALMEARREDRPDHVPYRTDASKQDERKRNLALSDDVVRALNERRVTIALEPVLCARTRTIQFYEALARVRAEDGSILGAGSIIPSAERFGLVKFVDNRILELAVRHLRKSPMDRVSVNVSMRSALAAEWMDALTGHLMRTPEVADRLIVEITETAAMGDLEVASTLVTKLKRMGLRVAIDDFGSGHTSFKSMRALPIDLLKIDGAFIQNLPRSTDDRFFVKTLIELARNLGVQTVAEWVQDEETARMLQEWGADFLQGEYCGRAEVIDDITLPAGEPPVALSA